jgi:hypothetical protein
LCVNSIPKIELKGKKGIGIGIGLRNQFQSQFKHELQPLLPPCADGSPLPVLTLFSDGLSVKNDHLLGFGLSYISENWQYRECGLFLQSGMSDSGAVNSASVIRNRLLELNVTEAYIAMGISDTNTSALAVTKELIDEPSNLCSMHLLGLVAGHLSGINFQMIKREKVYFEVGKSIVSSATELVLYFSSAQRLLNLQKFFKGRGLEENISPSLPVSTRPSSVADMMIKLIKIQPAIKDYVESIRQLKGFEELERLFDSVKWDDLLEFEAIIRPINSWVLNVQVNFRPTLGWNCIIPLILLQTDYGEECSLDVIDLATYAKEMMLPIKIPRKKVKISEFKQKDVISKAKELIQKYFDINHQVRTNVLCSAFLDPISRSLLQYFDPVLYLEAKNLVSTITLELAPHQKAQSNVEGNGNSKILLLQKPNKSKSEVEVYEDSKNPENWPQTVDVSSGGLIYLLQNCNPVLFWKENHPSFPKLARVARMYLSCNASTATEERNFSFVAMTRTDKRNSLRGEKLERLCTLRANTRLYQELRGQSDLKNETLASWADFEFKE